MPCKAARAQCFSELRNSDESQGLAKTSRAFRCGESDPPPPLFGYPRRRAGSPPQTAQTAQTQAQGKTPGWAPSEKLESSKPGSLQSSTSKGERPKTKAFKALPLPAPL